ncbi:metal ABC transporter ATP-binding protein [Tetragenococcus solitarius]|uniref:Metal ABC transporter ATP-binding protein n=1 Tax=Tetragenococcus solitarius TaxID=71453 RepID=A0ABN3Y179_9ENTE|nr:metal ABC transporter ATP-binding protein [Tetragenococcus solitarius]
MIAFDNISASYDGVHQAVADVSFTIDKPAIIGIIGPNGAGKSTFIKSALNLIEGSGTTTVDGQSLQKRKKEVAYVEQKSDIDYTFPITVGECVSLGLYPKKRFFQRITKEDWHKVDHALELVQMKDFKDRQIGELSGGQFQRILIARTFVQDATFIFLDEPFVGIDATSEQIIMELLNGFKKEGKEIFIVHHDLSKVERYFDELVILNKELIAQGPTDEVFTKTNLKQAFGDTIFVGGGQSND